MSDLEVVSFRAGPGQYAWTFGGAAPVRRIRTPAVLEVYTEDCFGGRVRSEQDLTSQVCESPFLNPQTGPFYLEGAEPGDTVAVHFMSIEPARSGEETAAMEPAGNGQSCRADLKAAPGRADIASGQLSGHLRTVSRGRRQ